MSHEEDKSTISTPWFVVHTDDEHGYPLDMIQDAKNRVVAYMDDHEWEDAQTIVERVNGWDELQAQKKAAEDQLVAAIESLRESEASVEKMQAILQKLAELPGRWIQKAARCGVESEAKLIAILASEVFGVINSELVKAILGKEPD